MLGEPAVPDGVFGAIVPEAPDPLPDPLPIAPPEPDGPLGELIEPVVPAGVPEPEPEPESDEVPPVEPLPVPLPIEPLPPVPLPIAPPEPEVDAVPLVSPPADGILGVDVVAAVPVLAVPELLDGFDIELSVFGASALLQAPSAARVAAMATHLIERCMFAPRWWNGARSVR